MIKWPFYLGASVFVINFAITGEWVWVFCYAYMAFLTIWHNRFVKIDTAVNSFAILMNSLGFKTIQDIKKTMEEQNEKKS